MNSWGVYLIAAAALVGVLAPQIAGVASLSREGADLRCAEGVRATLDSLRPGMAVVFSFDAWPLSDPILLGGTAISVSYGNGTVTLPVEWQLPSLTLSPSVPYRAWLANGTVQVAPVG